LGWIIVFSCGSAVRQKMEERLQKIIARAGVASRRHAEEMIVSGLVTVNGRVVTELGTKADPSRDHIKVGGKLLHAPEKKIYLALNKPAGVVATLSDPEGRPSLLELLRGLPVRVYPIGRLEYAASGLLLLTNDGQLTNRVTRAHGLRQTYFIKLKGSMAQSEFEELERETGVRLKDVKRGENPWYEVRLSESRRDALRQKLIAMGHPVEKIKRGAVGPVELGSLPPGRYRPLVAHEVAALVKAVAATTRFAEAQGKKRSGGREPFEREGVPWDRNRQPRTRVFRKRPRKGL
jgi:23S rRNA pseudouridine2605 synthase